LSGTFILSVAAENAADLGQTHASVMMD
jgi:hypothetical protein